LAEFQNPQQQEPGNERRLLLVFALTFLVTRTRFGMLIRAAAENRALTSALGIDQSRLYTAVFVLGAFLAGLAGALQLPREPANLGMDLSIIADAFVVTVVGGLGSIPGAFLAAMLIAVTKTFCIALGDVDLFDISFAFPRLTLVAEFIVMAIVLMIIVFGVMAVRIVGVVRGFSLKFGILAHLGSPGFTASRPACKQICFGAPSLSSKIYYNL
jgi:branched-subunit amino acid ABC-type transport system permease component